jgi:hypothetical protein
VTSELFCQLDEDIKEASKKEIRFSSKMRKTTALLQFLFTDFGSVKSW